MPALIQNQNQNAYPLPYPFRGVLAPGQQIAVDMTADQVHAAAKGIGLLFKVSDLQRPGTFDQGFSDVVATLDYATNIAIPASLGSTFRVTLAGNANLVAPLKPTDGQTITLEIQQDATGSRTLTLDTTAGAFKYGTDATLVAWVLSTTANAIDVATFKYRASLDRWMVLGLMRGY